MEKREHNSMCVPYLYNMMYLPTSMYPIESSDENVYPRGCFKPIFIPIFHFMYRTAYMCMPNSIGYVARITYAKIHYILATKTALGSFDFEYVCSIRNNNILYHQLVIAQTYNMSNCFDKAIIKVEQFH